MNTLPLVFAFVIMLALGSYAIFQDFASCKSEEKNYTGFMRAHRTLQTNLEKKQFAAFKGKLTRMSHNKKSKINPNAAYSNPRNKITLHPLSKLNILPLVATGPFPHSAEYYEIAAEMIRLLYQHTLVYQPNLEYKILDLLIEEGKKEENISFEALTSRLLKKDKSLYKIFKGTKKYQLFTKKGYPPLSDFLSAEINKSKKPINFHYATTPILLALFGDKVTAVIEKTEKEKWEKDHKQHTLTAQELEAILVKEQSTGKPPKVEFFVDFTQKTEANPHVTIIDPASGIVLKSKI
ncbi:MAG TPA: hypothetical protein VLG76_07210 [Rhabdochlamydiaceae bacterium]|nr:hypothetical protein [Rhabdochlamydiaceae bacterium]